MLSESVDECGSAQVISDTTKAKRLQCCKNLYCKDLKATKLAFFNNKKFLHKSLSKKSITTMESRQRNELIDYSQWVSSLLVTESADDDQGSLLVITPICCNQMVCGGRVVRCRNCDREVVGSNPAYGCCVPMLTQRAIPPGSVNEYQRIGSFAGGVNGHTTWSTSPVSVV